MFSERLHERGFEEFIPVQETFMADQNMLTIRHISLSVGSQKIRIRETRELGTLA